MSITHMLMKIGDTPYCYWDFDDELKRKNIAHIKGIDPEYFIYQAQTHWDNFSKTEDGNHHSAVGLQMTYHHSLETLFSLVCATIQSPKAIHFWQLRNEVKDIKELTKKIGLGYRGFSFFANSEGFIDWNGISSLIFQHSFTDETIRKEVIEDFTASFQRLSSDFTAKHSQDEYNSIKHGYRGQVGGFSLSFGIEKTPGVPARPEDMSVIGGSKWGATFNVAELIEGGSRGKFPNYKVVTCSNNWIPENIYHGINLVSMCLQNLRSALLIINGTNPDQVTFTRYTNRDEYSKPWALSCGTNTTNSSLILPEKELYHYSKVEINEACEKFLETRNQRTSDDKS